MGMRGVDSESYSGISTLTKLGNVSALEEHQVGQGEKRPSPAAGTSWDVSCPCRLDMSRRPKSPY